MDKEQLRMQMLAGIITEGQYKEKMEEVDSMGKIGASYPAPETTKLSFTPEQKEKYQNALIKKFYKDIKKEDEYEAVYNLSDINEIVIANILSGYKPLEMDWYASIGDWDNDSEDEEHPSYILTSKGYDLDQVRDFMDEMLKDFKKGPTNNPEVQKIQKIIQSYN